MTGGSATQAGIAFQNNVAAFLSAHILADAAIDFFGLALSQIGGFRSACFHT